MKIKRTVLGITSQIAFCKTCGKENHDYIGRNAQRWGRDHAQREGHTVSIQTMKVIIYN